MALSRAVEQDSIKYYIKSFSIRWCKQQGNNQVFQCEHPVCLKGPEPEKESATNHPWTDGSTGAADTAPIG